METGNALLLGTHHMLPRTSLAIASSFFLYYTGFHFFTLFVCMSYLLTPYVVRLCRVVCKGGINPPHLLSEGLIVNYNSMLVDYCVIVYQASITLIG